MKTSLTHNLCKIIGLVDLLKTVPIFLESCKHMPTFVAILKV